MEIHDKVICFLKTNSQQAFAADEIARELSLDKHTTLKALDRLERANIVERRGKENILYFRYGDLNPLSERFFKTSMIDYLEREGYIIENETYKTHGADIKALNQNNNFHFIIETKADPRESAQRENYFISALGQIITRMGDKRNRYGVAFPYTEFYTKIAKRRIPQRIRKTLRLDVFFVSDEKKVFKLPCDKLEIKPVDGVFQDPHELFHT